MYFHIVTYWPSDLIVCQNKFTEKRISSAQLETKLKCKVIVDGVLISSGYMSPVKRICVFEHSVMTNFNCACPAIQRGQGSGFLSEGSS